MSRERARYRCDTCGRPYTTRERRDGCEASHELPEVTTGP